MAAFARRYVTERRDLYPEVEPELRAGVKIGRSTSKGGETRGGPRWISPAVLYQQHNAQVRCILIGFNE